MGARGLVVAALSSLALTGALERLLLVLALLGVVLAGAAGAGPVGGAGLATGVLVAVGAAVVRRWRRARLDPLRRAVSAVVRA